MTNSSVRDYKTPMDWYLGRKPRDSIDDRVEILERMKSYFPSEHYRKAQVEKRQTGTFGSYFPTKEYLAIRETSNKERAERRKARNESISAVYNGAVVPAVKGVYNYGVVPIAKLMKASAKWAANRGYKLANNLIELYSLKQKYGDLDEELAKARKKLDDVLRDDPREDVIEASFEEVKPEKTTTSDYEEPTSSISPEEKTDRTTESPLEGTVKGSLHDEVTGTDDYKPLSESEIEELIKRTKDISNTTLSDELVNVPPQIYGLPKTERARIANEIRIKEGPEKLREFYNEDYKYRKEKNIPLEELSRNKTYREENSPFRYIAEPVKGKDKSEREIPKYEFPDSKYEEIKESQK